MKKIKFIFGFLAFCWYSQFPVKGFFEYKASDSVSNEQPGLMDRFPRHLFMVFTQTWGTAGLKRQVMAAYTDEAMFTHAGEILILLHREQKHHPTLPG
jgi:hypothetical protein